MTLDAALGHMGPSGVRHVPPSNTSNTAVPLMARVMGSKTKSSRITLDKAGPGGRLHCDPARHNGALWFAAGPLTCMTRAKAASRLPKTALVHPHTMSTPPFLPGRLTLDRLESPYLSLPLLTSRPSLLHHAFSLRCTLLSLNIRILLILPRRSLLLPSLIQERPTRHSRPIRCCPRQHFPAPLAPAVSASKLGKGSELDSN